MMEQQYKHAAIEALILASPDPLPSRKITQLVEDITPSRIAEAVTILNTRYADSGSSFRIRELAGGYQFYVLPEYVHFIEDLFSSRRRLRLTRAALETVAIVAYRQPVTKSDIEHIRGVASDGVLRTLLEKKLVTVTGRAETVGKPLQYGTTEEFLKFFGLAKLDDLPKMSEIEQLISAAESKDQTELKFEIIDDGDSVKLNIADGTFDPKERDEDLTDEPAEAPSTEAPEESDDTPDRRLVLNRSGESVDEDEVVEVDQVETEYAEEESNSDGSDSTEDQVPASDRHDESESDEFVLNHRSVASE